MDEKCDGLWAVIHSEGRGYMGKIDKVLSPGQYATAAAWKDEDLEKNDVLTANVVALKPAYDYFSPLRPVPGPHGQMGFSRDPIVTPADFCQHPVPVFIRPGSVIFLEDMHQEDRMLYESFMKAADAMAVRNRAGALGLELAGGVNGKPPVGVGGRIG